MHLLRLGSTVRSNSMRMIPKVLLYWWCAMTRRYFCAHHIHGVFLAGYVELYKLAAVRRPTFAAGTQDERGL